MTVGFEIDNSSDPQGVGCGTHQRDERPENPECDLTEREAHAFVGMVSQLRAMGAYDISAGTLRVRFPVERKESADD